MLARNVCSVWVAVTVVMTVTQANTAGKSDGDRLQVVQEEFLDIVGNLTSSVKDVEELMAVLHSQHGRQIGSLLLEGVMLGAAQKDAGTLLAEFWTQLQGRFSPEFQDRVKDYTDFFSSMDIRTIPYFLDQMFKKDELGNSIANMPMGQLVDLVQPTASKYGVDLRALMDSVMGKGKNNARDLLFAALDNLNMTSLFQMFSPPPGNAAQPSNEVRATGADLEQTATTHKSGEKSKKGRGDSTIRLFRPLVASLLRENKIDLDADAVLQVLAPLLNGDLMSQVAPLLSGLGLQAGDGLAPVLLNLLGGEKGMGKQAKPAGLLGVMGTLLARGNNKNVDLEGMLTMASMFMNMNERQEERKTRPSKTVEPDLGVLADLAGKLMENNDVSALLEEASNFLTPNREKNVPSQKSKESTRPTTDEKPRQLTDLVESLLLTVSTEQLDNRRIKDFLLIGKAFLAENANIGGFVQQASAYLSMMSMDAAKEKKFQQLQKLLKNNNLENIQWAQVFDSLQKKETRSILIQTMTPTLSEFVLHLSSKEIQQRIYMMVELKVQAALASYGVRDVTFKNFPERLAPLARQMAAAWRMPLNAVKVIEHLRDYLLVLQEWVSEGLAYMNNLPAKEVSLSLFAVKIIGLNIIM